MTDKTETGNVFVSNYPPFSVWGDEHLSGLDRVLQEPPRPETSLGVYYHIPFCRKRCSFCYFRVYTDKDASQISNYMDALASEIELYADTPAIADRPLRFVYFGGGTPSYISVNHLRAFVKRAQAALPWTGAEEVAFECEPGTLTQPKLEAIRGIGVTRLSLGIENFSDSILKENGRAHLSHEIERVRPWIEALDFEQLNVDLIAGMLGETWESWRETVKKTMEYGPDSVTIYQMEVPHNTAFSQELERLEFASWDLKRAWHDWAFNELEANGYELSSAYTMVKKSKRSRFVYRDAVWDGQDMLGTGVASFSHLSGVHFQNSDSWNDYLERCASKRPPVQRAYVTTAEDRLTRELILQLKLGDIDAASFEKKFGVDILDKYRAGFERLQRDGMASVEGRRVVLSREGLLRVDGLLPNFYAEQHQNARYT